MRVPSLSIAALAVAGLAYSAARSLAPIQTGKQPDGTFLVATGQRIGAPSIRFKGRPSDLALRP